MRVKWGIRLGVLALAPVGLLVQPLSAQAPTLRPTTTTTSTSTSTSTTTTTTLAPEPTTTTATPSTTLVPRRLPRTGGSVALTFDDGPSETFTPQVLDILARYNVKATFFLVGREAEASPALVQRMVAEGHVVGNHTWDHVDLTSLDEEGFRQQIDRTDAVLGHHGVVQAGATEQAAMDLRMQRLDAAVHHFRESGDLGDIAHGQAGVTQCLRRAARGQQFHAMARQRVGQVEQAGLVGNGQQRPSHGLEIEGHGEGGTERGANYNAPQQPARRPFRPARSP